jgi:hypothetical protein
MKKNTPISSNVANGPYQAGKLDLIAKTLLASSSHVPGYSHYAVNVL